MAFNARFCDDFYRSTKKCLFLVAEVHKEILEPTFLVGDDIFLVVSLRGNLDGNLELRNLSFVCLSQYHATMLSDKVNDKRSTGFGN
jgi:hypothetical protein